MHSISLILDKNKMLIFNMLHICHIEESDKKAVWLSAKLLADTNIFFRFLIRLPRIVSAFRHALLIIVLTQ